MKALACDECGACAKSGWKADAETYDGVDLPDDPSDFDYDDFIQREFGPGDRRAISWSKKTLWKIIAAMVLGYLLSAR
jgi:hypothetical protein